MSLIEFGDILESSFGDLITNKYSKSKKVIIVDENTHDNCLEYLLTSYDELAEAEVMMLPAGEENKVMEVCFQVWEALTEYQIGRKDLIINLGGGVVTDMGGFIASIFKRGVDFVHIPTSLLGMVDASIGGKNGIDLGPHKNQLGVIVLPQAIFIDPVFLGTLPENELWNGFAEVLKHALISDPKLWEQVKGIHDETHLKNIELIKKAARVKEEIVEKDPFEKNERKKLNFGHTVGHAIEGFFLGQEAFISHGHAVAIGMLIESRLSNRMGGISDKELEEIEDVLKIYPMIQLDSKKEIDSIIKLMKNDKKNEEGEIRGVVLKQIGKAEFNVNYDPKLLKELMSAAFL